MSTIRKIEGEAMLKQQPQAGLIELMDYLDSRGVRKGICTRNFESDSSNPRTGTIDQYLRTAPR